ncbi:MAG: FAD-dependent oxidoreductase, partial [Pseudomonadota bacterium]
MPNPEVIVIGAGAAGIGAGLELTARGVPHLILEAANRVGGRAHTDKTSLPYAWDRGCHWLHCADQNPLVAWADRLGAKISREVWQDYLMIWLGRGWVSEAEADDADQALDQAYEAIDAAAEAGDDRSLAAIIAEAPPSRWARQIHGVMQLLHSEDPDRVSVISAADYAETDLNWPVLSGYGDLIERMAAGLEVRLST